jgi:hypothetical protein
VFVAGVRISEPVVLAVSMGLDLLDDHLNQRGLAASPNAGNADHETFIRRGRSDLSCDGARQRSAMEPILVGSP